MKFNTSLFSQILHVMPRSSFSRLAYDNKAESYTECFSSWDQCVAMLFCQLAQAKNLHGISDRLAITCGKLSHLGLRTTPAKSTLSWFILTVPGNFINTSSSICETSAAARVPSKRKNSVSRTNCSASIPPWGLLFEPVSLGGLPSNQKGH